MFRDVAEHMTQICLGVEAIHPRGSDQTIHDGCPAPAVIGAGEEVVATADRDRAQRSFGDHIVDLDAAVIEIAHERVPQSQGIAYGSDGL